MASIVFFSDDASTRAVSLDDVEIVTIGRHPDSVVQLNDPSVSSHHATIKKREKGMYVQDLGSSNGTRLNGADIEEALLNDGDRVSFGDVQGVFYAGDPPAEQAAPEPKVVFVPRPDAPMVAEAAPVTGAPYVPQRRSRFSRPLRAPRRTTSGYPDQSGGGCATAMFLTGLFIVAFFIGLAMRHLKETDRSLMSDIINRITKSMPKVKIEQE
jgi:hypothetical protein